jgi:prevent-host-death family protein
LLDRVAQGEELTITKHGVPVAKLVPVNKKKSTPAERRAAIEAMLEAAQHNSLGGLKIKDLIAEGRR